MRQPFDRRRFVKGVGAGAALAALPPAVWAEEAPRHPLPESYLDVGLTGMARAGYEDWAYVRTPPGGTREDRTGVMNAHWGAAVISAYYLLREVPFEREVAAKIRQMVDLMVGKKAPYFEPFPEEAPDETLIPKIAASIEPGVEHWRAHGHRKIFAMLSIRALRDRPAMARPTVMKGLLQMAPTINRTVRAARIPARLKTPYANDQALIDATFEAIHAYRDLRLTPVGTRPRGGAWPKGNFDHWITHSDALVGMAGLGHPELSRAGHGALKFHIARERKPPKAIERDHAPKKLLGLDYMRSMAFWGKLPADEPDRVATLALAHALKVMYAYIRLKDRASDKAILPACEHVIFQDYVKW